MGSPPPAAIAVSVALALFALLAPPLIDGVERKIRASIHSRIGPPVTQTWLDLLKLLSKEIKLPRGAELAAFTTALGAAIAALLGVLLSLFASMNLLSVPFVVTVLVLVVSVHALSLATGCASFNPFASIGSFRRVVLSVVNEVGLVLSVALALFSRGVGGAKGWALLGVSTAMMLVAVFASSGRLPYDLHEAEPEIASGTLIELSGPLLALEMYSHLVERWALAALPIYVSVLPLISNPILNAVAMAIGSTVLWCCFATTSALLGRSRVDLAVKSLGTIYTLSTIAWVGLWIA